MARKKIRNFEVDFSKELGKGSYGVVFRAKCLDSEEVVAVKGVKL